MTSQIEKIDDFFLEIENQIRLQDEIQNRTDIEQKFQEGKDIIDEIEDNIEQQGYYKYNYHIKYASYLKTIEEVECSSKQKKLANKFERYVKNLKNENVYELRSNSITVFNEIFNTNEKYIQDVEKKEVEKRLKEIKENLTKKDDIIETFQKIFNQLYEISKTFENYKTIIRSITLLNQIVNNTIDYLLNQKEINGYTSEELRHFSITNGKLAFEKYREACKLADATDIKKQIKL
ncbi:hypothetical protein F8M41_004119 [Gigaspora margarita]|uniref:Uncharacterized protein n=1 Tax=Gigaspora margarita TaxID=4874 RepID=A0A8H4A5Y4_GIGMA|nr:hypothetical protein F8M41_004119 [Gigaspora margarita]